MLNISHMIDLSSWWASPMTFIVLIFGMVVGSFLNVCIIRIPEKTFFSHRRSVCPGCQEIIPFYFNIPVFSWLFLKGKAACCGGPISVLYPLVEFATGVCFVIVYWHFPFVLGTKSGLVLDPIAFIQCTHMLMFTSFMIVVSVIDIRLQIIPDVISFTMLFLSFLWIAVHPYLDWFSSIMGIFLGGGILFAVAWIYILVRREYGLGLGDVKLLAAIGGWLGVEAVLPTLFLGSVLGAIIGIGLMLIDNQKSLKTKLPFGPFLGLGAWLHMLVGNELMSLILLQ